MKFSIAHARGAQGTWFDVDMPEPVTIAEALISSTLFEQYPDLDLTRHKVGIYGKSCSPDTQVKAGDRVEIYLPIQRELTDDEDEDES
jgi:putative ubiquitin-RnfH superfamily antitoxin RatB of RatAB toxin-antitoxin module